MKKLILIAIIVFAASALLISGCKKSSSDTPAATPTFTNDAAFLAGTYSVHDSSITAPHTVSNYTVTIAASTTTNGSVTLNNFANAGTSVNASGTYTSSGNLFNLACCTAIGGGRTLGSSGSTILSSTAPVKIRIDYTSNAGNTAYENLAILTK